MQLNSSALRGGGLAIAVTALAACVPPSPEPTPAPTPAPTPVAAPAPAPAPAPPQLVTPTYDNWMDAPVTPGGWSYVAEPGETLALFGPEARDHLAMMRCDRATRRVAIARRGEASGQVSMRIRTETADRRLTASQVPGRALIAAEFAPGDPFLDAIAFSRGRFALEVAGEQPLFLPAWPEITRVIEDCRG